MTTTTTTRPESLTLRPYQLAAIQATTTAIRQGRRSGLWAMPTGCGKTVTFAALAGQLRRRCLVVVHRDELISQAVATFGRMFPGLAVGVVKAERNEWDRLEDGRKPSVVVASVQSLHTRRLKAIPQGRFGLVIADEAHHVAAPTWKAVLAHFGPHAFTLGVTATPFRADSKGLDAIFGPEPLYSYGLRQAITDGWLVRLRQFAIETRTTLDGVKWRAGDFAENELSRVVNTGARNKVVVNAYQKHAEGRRALVFAVDVQHAHDLSDAFTAAGVRSAAVSGSMPLEDRRSTLAAFDSGEIRVVANCQVLTEGYDSPGIEAILMARPTGSRGFYQQAVGRGLRLAEGKADLMVLDFVDASRHKLVDALSLLGATRTTDAGGQDVLAVVDEDRRQAEADRRIASQRPLTWRAKAVSPWPDLPDLFGYTPSRAWETAAATDKQLRFLRSFGVEITREITRGEAAHLICRALTLEAAHPTPPTPAQAWRLRKEGIEVPTTKREAGRLLAYVFKEKAAAVDNQSTAQTT